MKYLKTFEENSIFLKKYVLFKRIINKSEMYYVLEPLEPININSKFDVSCKKLYTYTDKDKLKKGKHQFYSLDNKKLNNIIFESDDLRTVVGMIPALKNAPKYNL